MLWKVGYNPVSTGQETTSGAIVALSVFVGIIIFFVIYIKVLDKSR